MAYSHDGKLLAAGDTTGDIQVFDAKNGQTVQEYHKQTQPIYGLSWSPDDRSLASASGDSAGAHGMVQVWTALTGKTVTTYTYQGVAMQAVT